MESNSPDASGPSRSIWSLINEHVHVWAVIVGSLLWVAALATIVVLPRYQALFADFGIDLSWTTVFMLKHAVLLAFAFGAAWVVILLLPMPRGMKSTLVVWIPLAYLTAFLITVEMQRWAMNEPMRELSWFR
jgi:hypothetical protein